MCQTDYDLPHFVELRSKSFEECILACASYAPKPIIQSDESCAVASFMATGVPGGVTCWLKSASGMVNGRGTEQVSSAVFKSAQAL